MGSNTGSGKNGVSPNNFNQEQDPFSLQSFPASNEQGQRYFPAQQYTMHRGGTSSGENYANDNAQLEVRLLNGRSFSQNQFSSPLSHSSQPPPHIPRPPSTMSPLPHQTLTPEAAEIKARLKARILRAREQTNSATSFVQGQAGQHVITAEGSSSLGGSPRTPFADTSVDDLVFQYSSSDTKMATEQNTKQKLNSINPNVQGFQRSLAMSGPPAKSQPHSLGSPTKVPKSASNGNSISNRTAIKSTGLSRHASNGSLSGASEGEIIEDPSSQKLLPATMPAQPQTAAKVSNGGGQLPRRAREEVSYRRSSRDKSPPRRSSFDSNPRLSDLRDDRGDKAELRLERRDYQPDQTDRRAYSSSDNPPHPRREVRDQIEEHRKSDAKREQKREDRPTREANPPNPTLAQVLPHDEDLREWLEITSYHDHPYRDKILNRRRAIAKLDAQKNALLAEMEAEERGGPPIAATMLPPPVPEKPLIPVDTGSKAEIARPEAPREGVTSNKRPYSNLHDEHEPKTSNKILRTDDRGERGPKIKQEDEGNHRRPTSSGYDASNRISGDRRTDRDLSRTYGEGRGHVRASSRERGLSPGVRSYMHRPSRTRGYDSGSDDYLNQDDRDDLDPRRFQVRGGYRGRAYDPHFRSRGRGTSWRDDSRSDSKPDFGFATSFGSRIASGKPFKDDRGFSTGGKGETRYFIVKSFNEENVLKCIDDSIWTTQAQNGRIFKEAFETCKNVILVFSINKSKAFQGYARMESLPGSVETPSWQKAINWQSAGAFKVKWLVICSTRFHCVGHLKNSLNENLAVLVGKDGQEIEERCAKGLIELIDDEADQAVEHWNITWNE